MSTIKIGPDPDMGAVAPQLKSVDGAIVPNNVAFAVNATTQFVIDNVIYSRAIGTWIDGDCLWLFFNQSLGFRLPDSEVADVRYSP